MEINGSSGKVQLILLKEFFLQHTVTSLAQTIRMTRPGIFKILKSLERDNLITITPIGKGKTSTAVIRINWLNPIVEKMLSLLFVNEANEHIRWQNTFKPVERLADFSILFGSILHDSKTANDIDLLCIVSKKERFIPLERAIHDIQKTQTKKIHASLLTKKEFADEIKNRNSAYLNAMKKGVVLFGHEKYIAFIKVN